MSNHDGTWESPTGRLFITRPAPDVILFTYSGHITADVVPFVESFVEPLLRGGSRPDVFIDMDRVAGYDSEYREAITNFGNAYHGRFGEIHVLAGSNIVALGVALANRKGGGRLKATTDRAEFESAIQASVTRHLAGRG